MNIFKTVLKPLTLAATVGALAYGYGQVTEQASSNRQTEIVLVENDWAVSSFELQVMYVAKALDGEARGHEAEWPHIMSAVFNRMNDPRWDDSLIGVLLTPRPSGIGCEIDAMCDRHMENLSTNAGSIALAYAAEALQQYEAGEFQLTHQGHSWATPEAADGHAYFEGLTPVAKGTGHIYFADAPIRPKARPGTPSNCAPTESIRPPKGRPVVQDPIILALMEAQE